MGWLLLFYFTSAAASAVLIQRAWGQPFNVKLSLVFALAGVVIIGISSIVWFTSFRIIPNNAQLFLFESVIIWSVPIAIFGGYFKRVETSPDEETKPLKLIYSENPLLKWFMISSAVIILFFSDVIGAQMYPENVYGNRDHLVSTRIIVGFSRLNEIVLIFSAIFFALLVKKEGTNQASSIKAVIKEKSDIVYFMLMSLFLMNIATVFIVVVEPLYLPALMKIGTYMLDDWLIEIMVWAVVIYLLIKVIWPRLPSIFKDKTDHLSTDEAFSKASEALQDSQGKGVLVGQFNGEAKKISTQDRAIVIGPPGTGKTSFLISQLLDWCESGRSFVCVDIKPEIHENELVAKTLKEKGYKTYCYDPTGDTGHKYNMFDDLGDGSVNISELSASLIPPDEKNAVFSDAAQEFLDAIVTHVKTEQGRVSLPLVREFMANYSKHEDLLDDLSESKNSDVQEIANGLKITANNERMLGSIFSKFRRSIRFLRHESIRDSMSESDFSLSELNQGKVGLFLKFRETDKQVLNVLASTLSSHIMRYLITHSDKRDAVLILLDEVGNMARIEGLKEKLNTIRRCNMPTWLYWQSKEQMQAYGEKTDEGPNVILGACDMQMVFRLNDNATAAYFSEKIGTVDRLVEKTSVTTSGDGGNTYSEDLVTEPVIRPHELQQLDDGEVVCTYRGKAWRGYATPYFELYPEYRKNDGDMQAVEDVI